MADTLKGSLQPLATQPEGALGLITREAQIPFDWSGLRLDQALAKIWPDFSRSQLQKWLKAGELKLDEQTAAAKGKVFGGERVTLRAALQPQQDWVAQPMPLDIIFEDDQLLVVNKPQGLVVHPAPGHAQDTLVNALVHYFPPIAALPRAGVVHRIDKDTTGLLVVAKTFAAHTALVAALQQRQIKRQYLALVWGQVTGSGIVDKPIGRHPRNRLKMAVSGAGKPAVTHYRIAQRFANHTLLSVTLETGRTHQIRVHLASIGLPIVGDQAYGGRMRFPAGANVALRDCFAHVRRQALHATRLALHHPVSGKWCQWEVALPEDLRKLIDHLGCS